MSAAPRERIQVGIPGFDEVVHGGLPRGRSTLLAGATGTGKTVFGLQFMVAGIEAGERGLYLSFEESRWQLERDAAAWGMDLSSETDGNLRIVSRYPARVGLEDLLVELKHTVEGFDPTRLVLDSITAVERNAPQTAFREFSVGLSGCLKARGVATMMTTTLPDLLGGDHATNVYLSTIADAIIALRYFDRQVRRAILVLKVRGSQHASEMHEDEILSSGMSVKGPIRGIGGILAGLAQTTGSSHGASVFEP